jgi:prenyltransferase beta subunit
VDDSLIIAKAQDGLVYRSKKEASIVAGRLWQNTDTKIPYYSSAQRNWFRSLERKYGDGFAAIPGPDERYLGEAFTASSAWHTLRALRSLTTITPRIFVPIWGLNHQLGSLELEMRS